MLKAKNFVYNLLFATTFQKRGIWYSFGTIVVLLQEILSVYPALSSPTLCTWTSSAGIPLYLFPFLNTTSLGVLGALAKVDDTEVVKFWLKSEVIHLCLQIMGTGSELSKTVATFIVQKIMLDEVGLQHIRATPECFFQAASVLASMVIALTEQPSTKLLKLIISCYLWLMDDPRACTALQTHISEALRDGIFDNCIRDNPAAMLFVDQLFG